MNPDYSVIGTRIGLISLTLPGSESGEMIVLGQIQKKEFFCVGACFRSSLQSVFLQTAPNRIIFSSLNRPVSPETDYMRLFLKLWVSIAVFCEMNPDYSANGARIGLISLTLPGSESGEMIVPGPI